MSRKNLTVAFENRSEVVVILRLTVAMSSFCDAAPENNLEALVE